MPDEKTYSTLLRGVGASATWHVRAPEKATRAGDVESIVLLLWEALAQESDGRR